MQLQSRRAIAKCGGTFAEYNMYVVRSEAYVYVRGTNLQVELPPAACVSTGDTEEKRKTDRGRERERVLLHTAAFMSNFLRTSGTNRPSPPLVSDETNFVPNFYASRRALRQARRG